MFLAATDPTSTATGATSGAAAAIDKLSLLHLPKYWPAQGDLIEWCMNMSPGAATILVIAGMIYLMFGWYAFKGLVTVNAAMAGGCLGAIIADRIADAALIGAIVGAVLAAATTWPMMKYAIAMMGGLFGALVGAALWRSCNLEPHLAWAGALIGLVAFGLLSFILFKASVMMYTSLQGAVMLTFGVLGLLFKYQSVTPQIVEHLQLKPFLLPLAIFIPAMLGLIYQQSQYGENPSTGSGGGGGGGGSGGGGKKK
ncbi:hypothetical protein BH09PLA1_BH09PLA1_28950 [soil metagenome]